jgi:hypothetical protein
MIRNHYLRRDAVTYAAGIITKLGNGRLPNGERATVIAEECVAATWRADASLFDGSNGSLPHPFAFAFLALAEGVRFRPDDETKAHLQETLLTVIRHLPKLSERYGFQPKDFLLLEMAKETLSQSFSAEQVAQARAHAERARTSPPR